MHETTLGMFRRWFPVATLPCCILPVVVSSPLHPCTLSKLPYVYDVGYDCVCDESCDHHVHHCDECGWDVHPMCIFSEDGSLLAAKEEE